MHSLSLCCAELIPTCRITLHPSCSSGPRFRFLCAERAGGEGFSSPPAAQPEGRNRKPKNLRLLRVAAAPKTHGARDLFVVTVEPLGPPFEIADTSNPAAAHHAAKGMIYPASAPAVRRRLDASALAALGD